jgi:hypothetical protein
MKYKEYQRYLPIKKDYIQVFFKKFKSLNFKKNYKIFDNFNVDYFFEKRFN